MGDSGCAAVADCDVEVQENAHTSPMEGIFLRPPIPWKFQLAFLHFLYIFLVLQPPAPSPRKVSVQEVWMFSWTDIVCFSRTMLIFFQGDLARAENELNNHRHIILYKEYLMPERGFQLKEFESK